MATPMSTQMSTQTAAPMFRTVLVANRGEIACRVIRTLRALGVRAVAVHSDADVDARHVREADASVRLGPAEAARSYLDVDAVVAAAVRTGAEAIHPGYGFLSENPRLARACEAAGVVLVGPGLRALEVMGDKIGAKAHVAAAGVPVVPGVGHPGLTDAELVAAADDVGFPLLIKPSAGGGGKGMHVVERAADLPAALAAARRVATSAFGDGELLLERYLPSPRHIEVQVLADTHGTVLHLGERECSLQRRHQKVIEEAPSPLLDDAARARLGEIACRAARSVDYVGAGTVEMLVPGDAPDEAYFLEMNTRLQVEHPVTEMVTGLDLVEWQLRVAAGDALPLTQADVRLTGHAVEARVYAEDPSRGFLPATGRVLHLAEPTGAGVRVDSALLPGLEVSAHYDPLLAKVVAHGRDRDQALARLDAALAGTTVLGVPTNIAFLRRLLEDDDVRAGRLDTGLLERLTPGMSFPMADEALVAAALWVRDELTAAGTGTATTGDGPWAADGWRLGEAHGTRVVLAAPSAEDVEVVVTEAGPEGAQVAVGGREPVHARLVRTGPGTALLESDGLVHPVHVARDGDTLWVGVAGTVAELRLRSRADRLADQLAAVGRPEGALLVGDQHVRSPMPGVVVAVDVADGDPVTAGQPLLTVEAMKMEHRLLATTDGTVTLTARPADRVALDQVVATIHPLPDHSPATHEGTQP